MGTLLASLSFVLLDAEEKELDFGSFLFSGLSLRVAVASSDIGRRGTFDEVRISRPEFRDLCEHQALKHGELEPIDIPKTFYGSCCNAAVFFFSAIDLLYFSGILWRFLQA